MNLEQQLKKMIAELLNIPEERVIPTLSLDIPKFQSSAGKMILKTAIRSRFGMEVNSANVKTFADLLALVSGQKVSSKASALAALAHPQPTTAKLGKVNLNSGLSCGIDIESVATFPECDDYWSNEFYISNFTTDEIAYCISQANPRLHFAARWCAKEALKKSSSFFMALDMLDIQLAKQPEGSVYLKYKTGGTWKLAPARLSVSHTEQHAVAMVIIANGSDLPHQSDLSSNSEKRLVTSELTDFVESPSTKLLNKSTILSFFKSLFR